ncbi:MAG TPA: arsinothricin resistance N-acetyltransferase ArsN1 family A [Vicinamibacterales bacterium]|jgi:phosphinothricin acetyltransferase|nr:arsinothricin resistance N-acetyltransferase ArsN1 family A [Vicinamibacterales bacterium]
MTVTIRPARAEDAEAIANIHNQGIVDRVATLETALRTPAGTREWLEERSSRHPVIVAIAHNEPADAPTDVLEVVGWGSLNRFNPRAAYDHVADFSVYVERAWRGQGIGGRLLKRLVTLARDAGFHKMVLAALARNSVGVALYEKHSFTRVGIYREMGQLDGKWVDVVLMERIL